MGQRKEREVGWLDKTVMRERDAVAIQMALRS